MGKVPANGPAEPQPQPMDLADEVLALIIDLTFVEDLPPIRDRAAFEARLASRRASVAKGQRRISRAEGFTCLGQYANAEAALEALPKERPDVVLMDINLPGMNGVECVRQLKQRLPKLQVLMLTVYEDTENIFNALGL